MTTPPEPQAPDSSALGDRVTSLEQGQQNILSKLDSVLGFLDRTPDAPAEPEVERPEVSIADEIRRQLEDRDRKAAKDKPKAPPAAPKAELEEKKPVSPVRRVERLMGWAE